MRGSEIAAFLFPIASVVVGLLILWLLVRIFKEGLDELRKDDE